MSLPGLSYSLLSSSRVICSLSHGTWFASILASISSLVTYLSPYALSTQLKLFIKVSQMNIVIPRWYSIKTICLAVQEMQVWSLNWEDHLKQEMTIDYSILAQKTLWRSNREAYWTTVHGITKNHTGLSTHSQMSGDLSTHVSVNLLPCLGYCKQCCNVCRDACIFSDHVFSLGV